MATGRGRLGGGNGDREMGRGGNGEGEMGKGRGEGATGRGRRGKKREDFADGYDGSHLQFRACMCHTQAVLFGGWGLGGGGGGDGTLSGFYTTL